MEPRTLIGESLVDQGSITLLQLRDGLAWQKRWGGKLGHALLALGYVEESALLGVLSRQLGVPVVEVDALAIPADVVRLVPDRVLRERRIVPLALLSESRRGPLVVATADPLDAGVLEEVGFESGKSVRPVLATQRGIDRALSRHLDRSQDRSETGPPPESTKAKRSGGSPARRR
jgi:type IV pilus assembly protein PilB